MRAESLAFLAPGILGPSYFSYPPYDCVASYSTQPGVGLAREPGREEVGAREAGRIDAGDVAKQLLACVVRRKGGADARGPLRGEELPHRHALLPQCLFHPADPGAVRRRGEPPPLRGAAAARRSAAAPRPRRTTAPWDVWLGNGNTIGPVRLLAAGNTATHVGGPVGLVVLVRLATASFPAFQPHGPGPPRPPRLLSRPRAMWAKTAEHRRQCEDEGTSALRVQNSERQSINAAQHVHRRRSARQRALRQLNVNSRNISYNPERQKLSSSKTLTSQEGARTCSEHPGDSAFCVLARSGAFAFRLFSANIVPSKAIAGAAQSVPIRRRRATGVPRRVAVLCRRRATGVPSRVAVLRRRATGVPRRVAVLCRRARRWSSAVGTVPLSILP
eukprot:gene8532-biopygen5898